MTPLSKDTFLVKTTESGRQYIVRHQPRSFDQGTWEVRDRNGSWCGTFARLTSARGWASRH